MNSKIKQLTIAALFAALACVATMIIKIPSPLKGYLNIGDCVVLLSGWLLPPFYGFLVIKGLMALVAYYVHTALNKKLSSLPSRLISGVLAEIVMVLGYFVFEGFMYGFAPSAVNIPSNCVQGVAGLILGTLLVKIFEKTIVNKLKIFDKSTAKTD